MKKEDVDHRDKPGDDGVWCEANTSTNENDATLPGECRAVLNSIGDAALQRLRQNPLRQRPWRL
jgi:hypothetical protein